MLNYREIFLRGGLTFPRPALPLNDRLAVLPGTPTTGASPNVQTPAPAAASTPQASWLWLGGVAAGLGVLWWLIDG